MENEDVAHYIEKELKAIIVSRPLKPIIFQDRTYLFTLYKDSSYQKIFVKPLESFQYGVFKHEDVPGLNSTHEQYLNEQLQLVKKHKEIGDFLFAAKLTNFIIDHSVDSSLIAKSLAELAVIGDSIAIRSVYREGTNDWMWSFYKYRPRQLFPYWVAIANLGKNSELQFYNEVHLDIKHKRNIMCDSYLSSNSHIYQHLYNYYLNTEWAEYALFKLIKEAPKERWRFSHEEILANGLAFLDQYPNSRYKNYEMIASDSIVFESTINIVSASSGANMVLNVLKS